MAAVASLSSYTAYPQPHSPYTDQFDSDTSRSPSPVPQLRPDDVAAKDDEADRLLEELGRKLSHVRIDPELANPTASGLGDADWDNIRDMLPRKESQLLHCLVTPDLQLNGLISLRKFLSLSDIKDNIDIVLRLPNIVQTLEGFLSHPNPVFQYETLWIVTNLASGTMDQTKPLVQESLLLALLHCLRCSHSELRLQACWALGNIAGDGPEHRDMILHAGCVQDMMSLAGDEDGGRVDALIVTGGFGKGQISKAERRLMDQISAWTLANLSRGRREPGEWSLLIPALSGLHRIFVESTDAETLSDALSALSRIVNGLERCELKDVLVNLGMCNKVVEFLFCNRETVVIPALRVVTNVVSGSGEITTLMVNANCIEGLERVLNTAVTGTSRREALLALSNILAGPEEHIRRVLATKAFNTVFEWMKSFRRGDCYRKQGRTEYRSATFWSDDEKLMNHAAWSISNATCLKKRDIAEQLLSKQLIPAVSNLLARTTNPDTCGKLLCALSNVLSAAGGSKDSSNPCVDWLVNDRGINETLKCIASNNSSLQCDKSESEGCARQAKSLLMKYGGWLEGLEEQLEAMLVS